LLAKIKLYGLAVLGFIAAVLYGLLQRSKRVFARHKEREAVQTLKAEHDAIADDNQGAKQEEIDRNETNKTDYLE